jgi:hypothetical protein
VGRTLRPLGSTPHAGPHGSGVGLVILYCESRVFRLPTSTLPQERHQRQKRGDSGQTACRADLWDAGSREIPYEVGLTHQSCFVAVAAVKDASHAVPQL